MHILSELTFIPPWRSHACTSQIQETPAIKVVNTGNFVFNAN